MLKCLKRLLVVLLILVVLAVAGYIFRVPLLREAGRAWVVNDPLTKADVIVVLGGGWPDRSERAAALFKEGEAPKILVSGFGDCESNEKLLERNGVTNTAIILEPKSRTTRENAEFSIPLLRQIGAHHVIIVSSWYHSRRALACFEHYAPDITFYSRPSYYGYLRAEWRSKGIGSFVKSEYVKLLGYWVCYGVCPL